MSTIQRTIRSLTSLRFFAALFVFLSHARLPLNYQLGSVGVCFFYVLSGFILTHNYRLRFATLNRRTLYNFYLARWAKIYPVYLLGFLVAIPLSVTAPWRDDIEQAVANILLVQSYVPKQSFFFSYDWVSWSLSDEVFFYVLFPFLLWLLSRSKRFLGLPQYYMTAAFTIWALLALLLLPKHVQENYWVSYIFPPTRLCDFLVGTLLSLTSTSTRLMFTRGIVFSSICEVTSLTAMALAIIFSPYVEQSLRFAVLYIPFCAFIIWTFAFERGVVSRALSHPIFVFLGNVSFSFYMFHELVIRYLYTLDLWPQNAVLAAVESLTISLVLSMIIYTWFEEPFRKELRRKLSRPASTPHKVLDVMSS